MNIEQLFTEFWDKYGDHIDFTPKPLPFKGINMSTEVVHNAHVQMLRAAASAWSVVSIYHSARECAPIRPEPTDEEIQAAGAAVKLVEAAASAMSEYYTFLTQSIDE